MKKTIGALMVAVSAIAMSANAEALEYNPYAGVEYNYNLIAGGSNDFNAGKIFAGTQYNKNFGTEVFFQRSLNDRSEGSKTHFSAYGIDALGYLPLGCDQTFSLIGTAGIGRYNFSTRTPGEGHEHDNSFGYRLGGGAEYNLNEKVAVRALVRYVDLGNFETNDMWEYSVGAKYNF